jgi:hypothetical protein
VGLRDVRKEARISKPTEQKCCLPYFSKAFLQVSDCPAEPHSSWQRLFLGIHTIAILYGSSVWRYRVNARKLSAECSLEPRSQSEDKQANCLSKNATCHIFYKAFLRVLACLS